MKWSSTFSQITLLLLVSHATCMPLANASVIGLGDSNATYVQDIMRLSKSADMRNYMNESADPCENFYEFACGNWAKINPANDIDHITTGFFEALLKGLHRKIAQMLTAGPEPIDTEIDKKVKDFYESCMKLQNSQYNYKEKLVEIINEYGQMPALVGDAWKEDDFNWLETVAKIAFKYGENIIIGTDILPDFSANTVNRVYVGHPDLPLESKSMYLDNHTAIYRKGYKEKIVEELKTFLSIEDEAAKTVAQEILDFEIELAKGMIDDKLGLGLDDLSLMLTVDELEKKYGQRLNIKQLVNISLGELPTEPVYEVVEKYQYNLISVMQRTPKRVVANYIFYTLLGNFFLSQKETPAKREKQCIEKTKAYFAKNLDNMIYRRYNTMDTERDINLIWAELKDTFKAELLSQRLDWINLETRQYAIEKLNAMVLDINSYTKDNFTEEFGDLNITNDDYIQNVMNTIELETKQALADMHNPPKPLEAGELLSYTPANIILENKIKLPVSLLQPNYLWAANYPNALKFGTLGTLIGHELIHGFDDSGRKFNKDGNSIDWWDLKSTEAFVERTKCFTKQYSKYIYGNRFLPESTSQSENIADNGGLRLAYDSYLRWYEAAINSGRNLSLETLPSMNYTSKQLFFISYAQVWCNDAHPRVRDLLTSTDEHVPGMFRVIGTLSNFDLFSEEFKCAAGTKMNPVKKCTIY